ncbi:MAG: hypothetical protein GY738_08190, partial [Pseudoalteromonas sp.]|nr:hypothetical protein [Pseudoalteromonas sp.]
FKMGQKQSKKSSSEVPPAWMKTPKSMFLFAYAQVANKYRDVAVHAVCLGCHVDGAPHDMCVHKEEEQIRGTFHQITNYVSRREVLCKFGCYMEGNFGLRTALELFANDPFERVRWDYSWQSAVIDYLLDPKALNYKKLCFLFPDDDDDY